MLCGLSKREIKDQAGSVSTLSRSNTCFLFINWLHIVFGAPLVVRSARFLCNTPFTHTHTHTRTHRTYNSADTIYYKIADKLEAYLDAYVDSHVTYEER